MFIQYVHHICETNEQRLRVKIRLYLEKNDNILRLQHCCLWEARLSSGFSLYQLYICNQYLQMSLCITLTYRKVWYKDKTGVLLLSYSSAAAPHTMTSRLDHSKKIRYEVIRHHWSNKYTLCGEIVESISYSC